MPMQSDSGISRDSDASISGSTALSRIDTRNPESSRSEARLSRLRGGPSGWSVIRGIKEDDFVLHGQFAAAAGSSCFASTLGFATETNRLSL